MSRTCVPFLVLAFAFAFVAPCRAADNAAPRPRGYMTAFACEALAKPLQVHVEVADNSTQNLHLKDLLVQRLTRNGAKIVDSSPQVLSLEVAIERQATRTRPADMIDVRVGNKNPDNSVNRDFARVRMNIWSSTRDSLLTGRQSSVEQQGFDMLQLRASLNSRKDGRCLWQGEIVEDLENDDPYKAAARLIPELADAVGQAVNRKPIN